MRTFVRFPLASLTILLSGSAVFGGFPSLESYLPAVGRIPGAGGAEFYTTIWATNLTSAPVSFTFAFLKQGQANTSPASFSDNLAPGQTRVYENVVESQLGLSNALGGARVTSTGEILVAERIYNQPPGADLGNTEGLFFAGVPRSFSISLGQSASIQGINQGGAEDFRYNFALLETGGGSPTVNVQLFDGDGVLLGEKAYPMQPYEQIQPNVKDLFAGVATTNARITATVTGGTGSILIAGAQLANVSQDSSGFEMSFRDDLLGGGGGGTAGVTSLNGLTGALTIAHGANTTVNVDGHTITIDAVSGSGTGLTAVAHDNSLAGSGTASVPLGIANGQAVRSLTVGGNVLHDAVALAAGTNVTLVPSGNTITISSAGGGGGALTLPYIGEWDSGNSFQVLNNGTSGAAVDGSSTGSASGINGFSASGYGVRGSSNTSNGVIGLTAAGNSNTAVGVYGVNNNPQGQGAGVGGANAKTGNLGFLGGATYGVAGVSANGGQAAVYGTSSNGTGYGVEGTNSASSGTGVYGSGNLGVDGSGTTYGLHGTSSSGDGVYGSGALNGVYGTGTINGVYGTGNTYGVNGVSNADQGVGVYGKSTGNGGNHDETGVWGSAPSGYGLRGDGTSGLYATGSSGTAAVFAGDIIINTHVHTTGVGDVKFDDPGDPANRTITHSFVGSSEMKNLYDGVATLGPTGVATVELPSWFETLNKDFRYQLTALGTPQAGLFVSKEIADNRFTIAGGVPGARVSWLVTGVRRDPWAQEHPIVVREEKPESDRGYYLHPELYGQPKTKSADPIQRSEALKAESDKSPVER